MAEVVMPTRQHHRHTRSVGAVTRSSHIAGAPAVQMIPNTDFSFPMLPQVSPVNESPASSSTPLTQPKPAQSAGASKAVHSGHRRAVSALPAFSFNSTDASGLVSSTTSSPPSTPPELSSTTPSRRGHKRGGSELIGGDSRQGMDGAISLSPTKADALPLPLLTFGPPAGRRGHAHRRSQARSSNDVTSIMQASDLQPRLSTSLPSTPLERPARSPPLDRSDSAPVVQTDLADPFGPPSDSSFARPPSRAKVGFSDTVEYIPRPLSTISSETESSISTARGHSVNNSISSMLSPGSPSSSAARNARFSLSTTFEDDSPSQGRGPIVVDRRSGREREWYDKALPTQAATMPPPQSSTALSPPVTAPLKSALHNEGHDESHKKKHTLSHALGLDRRRSEPVMSTKLDTDWHRSALSLHDGVAEPETSTTIETRSLERKSSSRRVRDWALSMISRTSRKTKAVPATTAPTAARSPSPGYFPTPEAVVTSKTAVAETDLDTVFNSQSSDDEPRLRTPPHSRTANDSPTSRHQSSFQPRESDDSSPVLDLDAALGPFKTPPLGSHRQRRELHSSRVNREFAGPGAHYHRRAESAPALTPFEMFTANLPQSDSMADVFEEDEGDEAGAADRQELRDNRSLPSKAGNMVVPVIDKAVHNSGSDWTARSGLGIERGDWVHERPTTHYGSLGGRLSTPAIDRRAPSIVEETIFEESSPVDAVQIVASFEEPRASSLTKDSDSSDTPTLMAPHPDTLTVAPAPASLMTPDTYHNSAFSTPDFGRRQTSFDTSRLGTSASSIADNRTMSSFATGDHGPDYRGSVDDVPSLTSSRSTMMSNAHGNSSRRDISSDRNPSVASGPVAVAVAAEPRRKRGSIQSLSQLVNGSFGNKNKSYDNLRTQTGSDALTQAPKKKEHRLKKLMFWRSKSMSRQTVQEKV